MKTILVPTDFSQPANNALAYATELAVKLPARLLLLNVFWVPVYESDIPGEVATKEKNFRAYARQAHGGIGCRPLLLFHSGVYLYPGQTQFLPVRRTGLSASDAYKTAFF